MKGYMGRLLFVNLSSGEIKLEAPEENLYRDYIGGYGLGARILYNRQSAGIDPLGPDNTLGLVTGPFTGTLIPSGARFVAVGKSPLTGGWGDANCGGDFGPYLKFAGYDAIFFTGIADKPVYLLIDNGQAELKGAVHLWGKDSYETEDTLMAEYGKESRVTCIGQAGEKRSLIASIMTARGSAAARSGLGAVMGAKNLKAVVVRGNMEVSVADRDTAEKLRKEHILSLQAPHPGGQSFMKDFHKYGTSNMAYNSVYSGDSPVKNWGGIGVIDIPDRSDLDPDILLAKVEKVGGCWHCPLACKATLKAGTGEYNYAAGGRRPEYETQASFGANCCNSNMDSISMVNDICNRYGMDTISTGNLVAFATECYEKGIINDRDTDRIKLGWGNHQAIVSLTEKIAKREGLGDLLADGVKIAARKLGKGSEQYAVHIGGQEPGMHDPKLASHGMGAPTAARYLMDATPGRHTQGFGPSSFQGHVVNASGMCQHGFGYGGGPQKNVRLTGFLNSITGLGYSVEEMFKTGERIMNIRHAFNLREGISELNWEVHPRVIGDPPQNQGPLAGVTANLEKQVYWNLGALDWDMVTGKPSKKKLLDLGLDDVAEQLWPENIHLPGH